MLDGILGTYAYYSDNLEDKSLIKSVVAASAVARLASK